jgi:ferritin-like metal-binding protein YciE
MATIAEPRDLFVSELQSMLYVEQRLANDVLPELGDEINHGQFKQGIQQHQRETERHVANLERALQLLGEEAKPDKSHAIDGLVAQHDKVAKNIKSDELLDVFDAGAAAKTEHLEIAAYEGMITTAESLGQSEIKSLLEENLRDEKNALVKAEKAAKEITGAPAVV